MFQQIFCLTRTSWHESTVVMTRQLYLYVAIGAVMVDSIIELAFVSSMVGWLHKTASGTFSIKYNRSTFDLIGEPRHLLVDQGHSSNGSAGTAFIVVGIGGILALWLRSRSNFHTNKFGTLFYRAWLVFTILATIFTLATLAYVFTVTNAHEGQTIDESLASTLVDSRYPNDTWTPQGWFDAVLQLDLASASERDDIAHHLRLMRGWQYNLIPMFLLQLALTILAVIDAMASRRKRQLEILHDDK